MDGENIGHAATAPKIAADGGIDRFGSIDGLVNNAGIFFTKRFIDYTCGDLMICFRKRIWRGSSTSRNWS